MNAIRSTIFLAYQLITVAPWSFICLACAPLPLPTRYRVTMKWVKMCIWGAEKICGIRWQVQGEENLPDSSVILLSKHQSTWETLFFPAFLDREVCFVFKRELLRLPFFGWGIGLLEMIHIDRRNKTDAFEQVVSQGAEKLAQGRSIIMFPEGTRIPVGEAGRYKHGGARLATRTGATVVPVAVNSGRLWPRKAFLKYPGTITVSFGPAIDPEGKTAEELSKQVASWIETEMHRISPQDYETPVQANLG
jgi:1-acyl-sn-glycerol-3-phosphate acyltransferase